MKITEVKVITENWRTNEGTRELKKVFTPNGVIGYAFDEWKPFNEVPNDTKGIRIQNDLKRLTQDKTDYELTIDFLNAMIDSCSKLIDFKIEKITVEELQKIIDKKQGL